MEVSIGNIEDASLVSLLKSGDHHAFRKLYQRYSPRIYGKLLKLTKIPHIAEELLQETFVKVWEKRHTLDPEQSFKAWLFIVAEREVFQFYRKVARDKRLQKQIMAQFGSPVGPASESDIFTRERNELLQQAIDQLSPQRRDAFRLCRLEGKSYQEAGAIMGISPSTVSNHLVKANAAVRTYLFRHRDSMLLFLPLVAQYFFLSKQ